ncbi:hypothetical protein P170DRAFT_440231 [Aspergillus steynii IBT 23096]|uniref:Selenoprotein domain protein n=1 Tax=Aspergillus steynii IBT 23096 TaxID=1392250 RepID=A0A2I2FX04_9EURO|nr:uncharacterized protein P170DRAFT_440231 [Aspergillus steynii IBT 23096]PLB45096.1 hypothetical protein P170DRAFT_440231 [Aspergillus steynii IBT 23096]
MSEQQPPPTTTAATPPPSASAVATGAAEASRPAKPRVAIQYCTQCKWMLRAAYFAQELLSTFSTDLQEVSLIPTTGGIFTVTIYHSAGPATSTSTSAQEAQIATQLWDRKTDGGFPEVKVLKSRVRNVVDPGRSLGHTDRALKGQGQAQVQGQGNGAPSDAQGQSQTQPQTQSSGQECEDCR